MAILGMGGQTDSEKHVCKNCGKDIKAGEHFTKEGEKYCCENCCSIGPQKDEKEKAKVCEFC